MNQEVLIAAPGYLYAADFALAAVMLSLSNPPRGSLAKRIVLFAGLPLASALFSQLTDHGIDALYFPLLSVAVGMCAVILALTTTLSARGVIYFTFHAFILGEFATAFAWQICLYLLRHGFVKEEINLLSLLGLVIAVTVLAAISIYVLRLREAHLYLAPDRRTLLSVGLTALGIFLFSNISNVYRDTPFSGDTAFQINLIRMLVDAGGVILLEASRAQRERNRRASELEIMQRLVETQYENYRASERSIALIQQKYHDLKHQIRYLKEAVPGEERQAALQKMEEEIRSFEALSNTGNKVMDTILTDKMLQCQSQGIRMTCMADGHLLDFMPALDLSALLGNLLDNAIEYVSQLNDESSRWIELRLREKGSFIVLEVENGFPGQLQFVDGLPKTTKGDENYHGFGTRSVQATAARYGGAASFTAEGGSFLAKVSLVSQGDRPRDSFS